MNIECVESNVVNLVIPFKRLGNRKRMRKIKDEDKKKRRKI